MDDHPDGPWLSMAVFCEKVLLEKDDVISLVRVVDRFNLRVSGEGPAPLNVTIVVVLKSGGTRGGHSLTIRPTSPSGLRLPPHTASLLFEGDGDRGAGVLTQLSLGVEESGIYWFDVLLSSAVMAERLMTRMPLRVIIQRTVAVSDASDTSLRDRSE